MAKHLLALAALLGGCASAPEHEWRSEDTRREIYYAAVLAADSYSTAKISRTPGLHEGNGLVTALIGKRPKSSDVWKGSIVAGIAHYLIARRMKPERRKIWQYIAIGGHALALKENCDNGLC